jgi:hypothetical protein
VGVPMIWSTAGVNASKRCGVAGGAASAVCTVRRVASCSLTASRASADFGGSAGGLWRGWVGL